MGYLPRRFAASVSFHHHWNNCCISRCTIAGAHQNYRNHVWSTYPRERDCDKGEEEGRTICLRPSCWLTFTGEKCRRATTWHCLIQHGGNTSRRKIYNCGSSVFLEWPRLFVLNSQYFAQPYPVAIYVFLGWDQSRPQSLRYFCPADGATLVIPVAVQKDRGSGNEIGLREDWGLGWGARGIRPRVPQPNPQSSLTPKTHK